MATEQGYWRLVDPVWDVINIYDGPEAFLTTFNGVPRDAGLLYAAHFCQSEVCNGGFNQFFSNSTGVLAPEARDGFTAIGQLKVASVLERAMSLLSSPYVRQREARQVALSHLETGFAELDDEFFDSIGTEAGGFELAADNYADRIVSA